MDDLTGDAGDLLSDDDRDAGRGDGEAYEWTR